MVHKDVGRDNYIRLAVKYGARDAEMAADLGVTRERVRQLRSELELPCNRGARSRAELVATFEARTVKLSKCWEFAGPRRGNGYRAFGDRYAHRFAWELANGTGVPTGLMVLHHCDNRACVRPDHLYVGTAADNARDREGRFYGRRAS